MAKIVFIKSWNLYLHHMYQHLLKECTVKLLTSPENRFLGTGFFVAPDKLATCYHVFFTNGKAVTTQFHIEGYDGEFTLDGNCLQHSGLDLLVIHLGTQITDICVNLEASASKIGDCLWGYSYSIDYPNGKGLVLGVQGAARSNGWEVLRVSNNFKSQSSNCMPVLNMENGKFLGVTYEVKDHYTLIIPAQYFKEYFENLYHENQKHHQATLYWKEAQPQAKKDQINIFLCHASEDKNKVLPVYEKLKAAGFNPWLDKKDLLPGQDWDREIRKALKNSHFILIFFSHHSVSKRGYVQREFKLALDTLQELPDDQIFIIPVRLDDCQTPELFSRIQYSDLFEEEGLAKIIKAIEKELESQSKK